jgi:hypothetical protein
MVFRFLDPNGAEILVDKHTATQGGWVTVTAGVFTVSLGSGAVFDGTGAGTYTSLADVFRDYADVSLEIQVNGETLSPTVKVLASAFALNASNLGGKPATSFLDTTSAAQTKPGPLTIDATGLLATGITVKGNLAAGQFQDSVGFTHATIANGSYGVDASGWVAAAHFHSLYGSGEGYGGRDDIGFEGYGTDAGGAFSATGDDYGWAYLGTPGAGIVAEGETYGGSFVAGGGSGWTYVADEDRGVDAQGDEMGGYFFNGADFSSGRVGYLNRGIWGKGYFAGGTFSHPNDITFWADVSTPTKKIQGTGTVSFVQNHPYEKDKVVVYAAPEGDEVAVYTRGSGRLTGGEARVKLGATFAFVANPDVGLTAHVTPVGDPVPLSAEVLSTSEILVRGPAGSSARFDYLVYGLRIGFERHPAIQKKEREAFLPEAGSFDALGAADEALRASTPLARFETMRLAEGEHAPLDLSRAETLANGIDDGKEQILAAAESKVAGERAERASRRSARKNSVEGAPRASAPAQAPAPPRTTVAPSQSIQSAPSASANVLAPSILPPFTLLAVTGGAKPGDVLVLDDAAPGSLRMSQQALDPGVAGCALEDPEGLAVPTGQMAVGTTGAVLCRVDASYGAIALGDLLTTSPTPGHAMRTTEPAVGAILGKAMEPISGGTGTIRVLVTLR